MKGKKKSTKSINSTSVSFLLDESGSMSSKVIEAINGFNSYLDKLKKEKGKISFSLTKFNTNCNIVHDSIELSKVKPITSSNYIPNGFTALHDAVGNTVDALNKKKADRYLVIILTDGEENSSKKFSKQAIVELIQFKEKLGNWTFVYLGSTADAWATASNLGIQLGNAVQFDINNIQQTMGAVANSTSLYASSKNLRSATFCSSNSSDYLQANAKVAKI